MKLNELFPSRFLKADDAADGDLIYTIKGVKVETLGSGTEAESKAVLSFSDTDKQLVLNKTNANTIGRLYGQDTDDWIGKRVALFSTEVQFKDQMTLALRIRMKAPQNGAPAETVKDEPPTDDAWGKWFELAGDAQQMGITAPDLPDNVTMAGLRRHYGALQAQIKKAQADNLGAEA
jgi:hypothetical protein